MTRPRQLVVMAVVAVAAAAGGYAFHHFGGGENRNASEAVLATRLADLHGETQALGQWRGKVLVVNFWATWCTPCREEIPGFVRLQQKYGVVNCNASASPLISVTRCRPLPKSSA